MHPKFQLTLLWASLMAIIICGLIPSNSPLLAERLGRGTTSRPLLGTGLAAGQLREGQITDTFSSLIVRDGRLRRRAVEVSPGDEIWLIDGRQSHLNPNDLGLLSVQRLVGNNWIPESLENLVSAHTFDKSRPSLIYAHGNRTDEDWAVWRGMQFYQNTFVENGLARPPVRFIIWAWKSEQSVHRPAVDYREKSDRSLVVGTALANMLGLFPDREMVLVGYSLGVQAFLSALGHPSMQSEAAMFVPGQYRVVLLAPALDGCYVQLQLNQFPNANVVARTEIFDNQSDRALRVAKVVGRRQCPDGDVSITTLAMRGNLPLANVQSYDVAEDVGKGHSIDRYTSNDCIQYSINTMISETAAQWGY